MSKFLKSVIKTTPLGRTVGLIRGKVSFKEFLNPFNQGGIGAIRDMKKRKKEAVTKNTAGTPVPTGMKAGGATRTTQRMAKGGVCRGMGAAKKGGSFRD